MMRPPQHGRRARCATAILGMLVFLAAPCLAGPREQAKRIHDRLVGVPPSPGVLNLMETLVASGDPVAAAYEAMDAPAFYTTSLKNWVTPWTNVDQTVFAPLNDYTATVIGIVRDDLPFTEVLSADVVYIGSGAATSVPYSHNDNDHYEDLEENRVNLGDPAMLVPVAQSSLPGSVLDSSETAGVITTRAAGAAFFSAGTNRRMWRYLAINYLCRDMEELNDITRPADRIRQDVSRSPGGDSSIFLQTCVGCHSGMDPMAQAFAYFNFDEEQGRVVFTRGVVQPKYLINDNTFPFGFITTDNRWDNYWRSGPNAALGWDGPAPGGYGAKSLGVEVASSRAFAVCQVEKAFQHVCFRPPNSDADLAEVERVADVFQAGGYSMKRVFAETAAWCMGE